LRVVRSERRKVVGKIGFMRGNAACQHQRGSCEDD
jgi:hypothetical protein